MAPERPDSPASHAEPQPPKQLRALQEDLGKAFAQFESIVEHIEHGPVADRWVSPNGSMSARERADIYREQFWLRHRDALYEDYPALSHYLGDSGFEQFCQDYLGAHPPRSFTLRDLGNDTAQFAASYDGFESGRAAAARDLARFELAFVDLFDGAEVPHADPEKMATVSPEAWATARVALHPGLVLFAFAYPVHRYRTAVRGGGPEPERVLRPTANWLAMYRGFDLKVHILPIEQRQYVLLNALRADASLLDACDKVAATGSDANGEQLGETLRKWFHSWARRGWIVDVLTEASD